jgi:hypothetical protein
MKADTPRKRHVPGNVGDPLAGRIVDGGKLDRV